MCVPMLVTMELTLRVIETFSPGRPDHLRRHEYRKGQDGQHEDGEKEEERIFYFYASARADGLKTRATDATGMREIYAGRPDGLNAAAVTFARPPSDTMGQNEGRGPAIVETLLPDQADTEESGSVETTEFKYVRTFSLTHTDIVYLSGCLSSVPWAKSCRTTPTLSLSKSTSSSRTRARMAKKKTSMERGRPRKKTTIPEGGCWTWAR